MDGQLLTRGQEGIGASAYPLPQLGPDGRREEAAMIESGQHWAVERSRGSPY